MPGAPTDRDRTTGHRIVLLRYLLTATLVRLADEGARVALVLLALERTSDPAFGGALVAALLVPHVVAAPVVGAAADRAGDRRRFQAGCLGLFGAALAATALLVGHVHAVVVLAVVAVGGCCGPLITGGLTSLIRDLVPASDRGRCYSLDAATYGIAGVAGPAGAALLAGFLGASAAVLALAGSVVAGVVLLCTLPVGRRPERAPGPFRAWDGIALIWRDRTLLAVTLASSVGQLGVGAFPLVVALLATERHTSVLTGGTFLSAFAVGGLLGSIWYARYRGRARPARVVMVSLLAMTAPLALIPLTSALVPTLLLFGLAGFCNGPLLGSLLATREQRAPDDLHTQVFTLGAGIKMSSNALGSGAAGLLAAGGALPLLLAVAGCQLLAASAGTLLLRGQPDALQHPRT